MEILWRYFLPLAGDEYMSITVRLYGRFRESASRLDETSGTIGMDEVDTKKANTVSDLLEVFDLCRDEVSHVFVNGSYASLQKAVVGEDEVAIFPDDMGLLYSWYFEEE